MVTVGIVSPGAMGSAVARALAAGGTRVVATLEGRSVYYADAWVYGGDGTPGYTFDRKNRFAAVAHEPPRRIDCDFVITASLDCNRALADCG